MVSPFQNILMKNLQTICRVILAKTSQKMIVNLLVMVLIDLPIIKFTCQHHVSGYVRRVWHLFVCFFLLLIEIISIVKLWIIVHFFVLKDEKQTLSYIHTKFEGDINNSIFSPIYFVGAPVFLPQHWKLLGPERLMPLKLLGMNRVKSSSLCGNCGTARIDLRQFLASRYFIWIFSDNLRYLLCVLSRWFLYQNNIVQAWVLDLLSPQSNFRLSVWKENKFRLEHVYLQPCRVVCMNLTVV